MSAFASPLERLRNKRIVILGLGPNNRDLAGYLLRHGFSVTIRDAKASVRAEFEKEYSDVAARAIWEIVPDILTDLDRFDVLFRSPGIPAHKAELERAVARGAELTSQTKLFMDLCPAITIGVTGTKGKGTTCTLTYLMLRAGYAKGKVYLGGNIGVDPFSFLDRLTEDDIVVLELSSFQLVDLTVSPHISVLLNIAVDHLDHHRTLDEYRAAKLNLIAHQRPNDVAIINTQYPITREAATKVSGKLYGYTRHQPARQSAWAETLDGKEIVFIQRDGELESFDITGRRLLGDHNLENILPAALVAAYFRIAPAVMAEVIVGFGGLEHRLAFVGEYHGVRYIDDSIATTPEACAVAMEAFPNARIHLIVGGKDKGQDHAGLAKAISHYAASVAFLPGAATPALRKAVEKELKRQRRSIPLISSEAEPLMETLLSGVFPHTQSGDVVLLAPAAASDAPYANYKERGDAFVRAVRDRYKND